MGRPSYAIASTSRISQKNIVDYVLDMAKKGRFSDIYVLNPGSIRTWLDKRQPYNAKIVKDRNGKTTVMHGEIFSTPREFRAGETITAATPEEMYKSAIALSIKRLKAFKAKSVKVSEPIVIAYHHDNGDVIFLNCPNGTIPLDADKSQDIILQAWIERKRYLATMDGLSDKDKEVKYNETVRNVNTKGAQVANLLKALSDGKMDSAAFAKACAKLDKDTSGGPEKNKKGRGTVSVIGMWGR